MDEAALEAWSENLMTMRQERLTLAQKELEEKGSAYSPAEFYDQSVGSLDKILEKWVAAEQEGWDANLPEDPPAAMKGIRSETDGVIDLETESIQRDLETLKDDAHWEQEIITSANSAFQGAVNELRNKYQLKLNNFNGAMKKRVVPPSVSSLPSGAAKMAYGGSSGGSGAGMIVMFLIGLILGAGPSAYFWDAAKKMEKKFGFEKSRIVSNQQVVEDNYALLHDIFSQMATAKMKNLPDMEDQIRGLKAASNARKKQLDQEYAQERERLFKKYPAGDRLDRAVEDLEYRKVQKDGELREDEQNDLERLEKQRKIVKDLLAG